jgi:hypothetical protein
MHTRTIGIDTEPVADGESVADALERIKQRREAASSYAVAMLMFDDLDEHTTKH